MSKFSKVLRNLRKTKLITISVLLFFVLFLIIFFDCYLSFRAYRLASEKPKILWLKTGDISDYWFVNSGRIACPVNATLSVACDVFTSWEEHPNNVNAYVFYGPLIFQFRYRNPNELWGLFFEETIKVNTMFYSDKILSLFNFSSTFSRYSDVPISMHYLNIFPWTKTTPIEAITNLRYYVKTSTKNSYLKEIAPVLYLQSNWQTFVHRDDYVLKLMEYIDIDSYGNCLNNKQFPQKITEGFKEYTSLSFCPKFLQFTARYKFTIAIENSVCNDYVTEKLWRPIVQGVVPIYFGSPTIRDWLPNNKSAILIEDFATPELLARHLHQLLQNDTKYEEHLEHKTKGLISNQKLISELKTRPYQMQMENCVNEFNCFFCRKLHEVNNGKVNIVTRKALDCKMPLELLTRKTDTTLTDLIKNDIRTLDNIYLNITKHNSSAELYYPGSWSCLPRIIKQNIAIGGSKR